MTVAREVEVKFKFTGDLGRLQEVLDKLGTTKAQISEAGESAEKASKGFGGLKDGLMELGQTLLGLFTLQKIGAWLMTGAEGAEKEERAFRQVGEAAKRWGLDADDAMARAETLADALLQLGHDGEDTAKVFREFIDITHDLDEAQSATALSAQIAAAKDIQLGEAQGTIIGLIQGRKGALKEAQKMGAEGAKTEQEALDILTKSYGHYSETLDDTIVQKQKFKAELDDLAEEMSGPIQTATLGLIDLFHGVALGLGQLGAWSIKSFQTLEMAAGSAFEFISKLDWKHPLSSQLTAAAAGRAYFKEQMKGIEAEYKATMDELDLMAEEKWGQKGAKLPPVGKIKTHGKDTGEAQKIEADAVEKLRQAYQGLAEDYAALAAEEIKNQAGEQAIRETAYLAVNARKALLTTELAAIEATRAKEMLAAKGNAVAMDAIDERFSLLRLQAVKKASQDEIKINEVANQQILASKLKIYDQEEKYKQEEIENALRLDEYERKRSAKIDALQLKDIKKMELAELKEHMKELQKEYELEKTNAGRKKVLWAELMQAKVQLHLAGVQAILGALQTEVDGSTTAGRAIFAAQKSIEAARALISAFSAASGAAAETPGDVYTRIAAYVAAFAQVFAAVTAIGNINPGGGDNQGFDDPEHDAMARAGGLRWARDMVREWNTGISAGWAEGMRNPGTSITNGPTIHNRQRGGDTIVNQTLLTGAHADYAFRQLDRKLRVARRQNDRAMLAPPVTRIGSKRRVV